MGRRADLDALRAGAMSAGVLLHASLDFGGWQTGRHGLFDGIYNTIHAFRMPLFFAVAGWFAAMSIQRWGPSGFVVRRVRRIVVPFLAAGVTVIPVTVAVLGGSPGGRFDLFHLWFLWLLVLFIPVAVVAVPVIERVGCAAGGAVVAGCGVVTVGAGGLMTDPVFGPDTSTGLVPDPVVFVFYAAWFTVGVVAHVNRFEVPDAGVWLVVPAFAGLVVIPVTGAAQVKAGQVAVGWLLVVAVVAGVRRIPASRVVGWLTDASYWVYLTHLPVVIGVHRAFTTVGFNPGPVARYLVVVAVVFVVTFGTWPLVASSRVGRVLGSGTSSDEPLKFSGVYADT